MEVALVDGEPSLDFVGGGSQTSVRETLDITSELAGRELNVTYSDESTATCGDTSAARRDLGFAPATSLLEGLAATAPAPSRRRAS